MLSGSFVRNLGNKLPKELTIERDINGSLKLTEESCKNVYRGMHPCKKSNT
ncbi:hypothetical protein [Haloimpatiens massiliensis]|uniref:hypothetical protein n=1 Tax=Haloimpatiens massiliensis TaxID=1658110 RepID=UPI001A9A4BF5|nr:hypothetical protein [Haloimpatiens massiliensis]